MHVLTRERQQDAESAALTANAQMISAEFLVALKKRDLSAPALFAPMVTDWTAILLPVPLKRHQTIAEVLLSHVSGGTDFTAMVEFILDAAFSAEADLPRKARSLLNAITAGYGDDLAEVTQ